MEEQINLEMNDNQNINVDSKSLMDNIQMNIMSAEGLSHMTQVLMKIIIICK